MPKHWKDKEEKMNEMKLLVVDIYHLIDEHRKNHIRKYNNNNKKNYEWKVIYHILMYIDTLLYIEHDIRENISFPFVIKSSVMCFRKFIFMSNIYFIYFFVFLRKHTQHK